MEKCYFSQNILILNKNIILILVFVTPQIHWYVCCVWYILLVADHSGEFNKIIYIHIQTRFTGVFGFVWSVLKHQGGDIHLVGFLLNFQSGDIQIGLLLNFQSGDIQIGFLLNFRSGDIQISKSRHLDFKVETSRLDFY